MKKALIAATVTAAFAAAMATSAFADDVVVRTSVGSGEIVFSQTSEAVDITAEELTVLVKDSLKSLDALEMFNGFADAEAAVSLKLGEETEMKLSGSIIGSVDRAGEDASLSLFYSLDGFGNPVSGRCEAYHWVDDGKHYTAVSNGTDWTVQEEDFVSQLLELLAKTVDSDEAGQISLETIEPNLYQSEDGSKYYVCIYDKDKILNSMGNVKSLGTYLGMADSFLGDNDLKLIVIVDAETALPRAVSLDASGAAGQLPGEMFGMNDAAEYSVDNLYATFLLDTDVQEIEIPEEAKKAPVSENSINLDLNAILNAAGMGAGE